MTKHIVFLLVLLLEVLCNNVQAQTLIINEVSNGPSGSQEYVEFVVVDVAATYDCSGSAPPCVDIRGWIYDDNSGYHGTSGIASGAARFTNDPLWSCVPVGTIILLYNGLDPNVDTPADDVSLIDGNCVISVALDNPQFFEFTETTPGDIVCSYPATGWGADPSPDWSNVAMANGGDCARLVDLNGCEVFSLCYGSANLNPMIYFNSGGSGTDNNWFFNGGDPTVQANWSEGCAGDISACGSNDQTPGAPNNQANADYIGQFNNYCAPIPPLVVDSASVDAGCGCTGMGGITASGSIPGYTYQWYDATWTTIGQTNDTATNLCAGTYHAIATSSIGCEDTVSVIINSATSMTVSNVNTDPLCFGACNGTGTITVAGGTLPYIYAWANSTSTSAIANDLCVGFQSVTVTDALGCAITDTFTLAEPTLLTPSTTFINPLCFGSSNGSIDLTVTGGTLNYTYLWDDLAASTTEDISGLPGGTYTVQITDGNNCLSTTNVTITEPSAIVLTATFDSTSCNLACDGGITASSIGGTSPYQYSLDNANWGLGIFSNLCIGNYTVYVEGNQGCIDSVSTNVSAVINQVDATISPVNAVCENALTVQMLAVSSGGTWSGTGITNSTLGTFDPLVAGVGSHQITYTISGVCGDIDVVTIDVLAPDNASIDPVTPVCEDAGVFNLSAQGTTGQWSGIGISNNVTGEFSPAVSGVGSHTIYYTTNGACPYVDSIEQIVLALDTPVILIVAPVCANTSPMNLGVNIAGGIWSGAGVTDSILGVFSPAVVGPGNHIVTYNLTTQCGGSDVIIITVNDVPQADIVLDSTSGCAPLSVTISNPLTVAGNSCVWDLGNGDQSVGCGNFSYVYSNVGCFDISVTITDQNSCSSTTVSTTQVCVEESPVAQFSYTPEAPMAYDGVVSFINETSNGIAYQWWVNGELYAVSTDATYDFEELGPGTYPVCLIAENAGGCPNTYCTEIKVSADFSIYVPNSFTPNGDGNNDFFGAIVNGAVPEEFSMSLFDRWGVLFFDSNDYLSQWDGTYNGLVVQQDVYVWKISYLEPETNERKELIGHVSLLR